MHTASATPHESGLVQGLFDSMLTSLTPDRVVGERDTPAVVVEGSGYVERDLKSAGREAEQHFRPTVSRRRCDWSTWSCLRPCRRTPAA